MITSLGMASIGLLDRGTNASLHIAAIGLLRTPSGGVIGDEIVPRGITHRERQLREEDEIILMVVAAFIQMIC